VSSVQREGRERHKFTQGPTPRHKEAPNDAKGASAFFCSWDLPLVPTEKTTSKRLVRPGQADGDQPVHHGTWTNWREAGAWGERLSSGCPATGARPLSEGNPTKLEPFTDPVMHGAALTGQDAALRPPAIAGPGKRVTGCQALTVDSGPGPVPGPHGPGPTIAVPGLLWYP
jgi:hypothetical protein